MYYLSFNSFISLLYLVFLIFLSYAVVQTHAFRGLSSISRMCTQFVCFLEGSWGYIRTSSTFLFSLYILLLTFLSNLFVFVKITVCFAWTAQFLIYTIFAFAVVSCHARIPSLHRIKQHFHRSPDIATICRKYSVFFGFFVKF